MAPRLGEATQRGVPGAAQTGLPLAENLLWAVACPGTFAGRSCSACCSGTATAALLGWGMCSPRRRRRAFPGPRAPARCFGCPPGPGARFQVAVWALSFAFCWAPRPFSSGRPMSDATALRSPPEGTLGRPSASPSAKVFARFALTMAVLAAAPMRLGEQPAREREKFQRRPRCATRAREAASKRASKQANAGGRTTPTERARTPWSG